MSVRSSQPELPLHVRRTSRRRHSTNAQKFFALGQLLRRQLQAEHMQRSGIQPTAHND
jgi:hypothetical protein